MRVLMKQCPVGQGGLHSVVFSPRSPTVGYWYIYDCGSTNAKPLARELVSLNETMPEDRALDLLLLSHLDEDHVNGVETLMATRDVRYVVLPYLTEEHRMILTARAARRLTESLLSLYQDPVRWFHRRGAHSVILVQESDENTPSPPDEPPPSENLDESADGFGLSGPEVQETTGGGSRARTRSHLRAGVPLVLSFCGVQLWEILPFWRPTNSRARRSNSAVEVRLPSRRGPRSPWILRWGGRSESCSIPSDPTRYAQSAESLAVLLGRYRPRQRCKAAHSWSRSGDRAVRVQPGTRAMCECDTSPSDRHMRPTRDCAVRVVPRLCWAGVRVRSIGSAQRLPPDS